MNAANFFLLQYGMERTSSAETSAVRFIPSGVISNAHEIATARMKPSARNTVSAFMTQVGASNVGNKIEAAWNNSQATTAYATATLYTLRRFSSAKKLLISTPGIY